jgi:hypothetical protein
VALFLTDVLPACLLLVGLLVTVVPARAQFTLFQGDDATLELGGYLRSLSGLYTLGYEPPAGEETSGFNAQVLRLKWTARFGSSVVLEVHDRIQTQVSSVEAGFGRSVAGFGVSAVPGRSVDLSTTILEKDRMRAWHDVDRLALTVYTGLGDLTVGRQAVTWGQSSLFPVADLWARFSPFELDTEEKPGVDALRLLSYPGTGWEVDAVVADRGSADDVSAGLRASKILPWADVYAAGGKFWNQALAMAGVSAPVGSWKLRAEAVLPYDLDEDDTDLPRTTVGVDWLRGSLMATAEYHFNGIGAAGVEDYLQRLQDPRFARGESYFLGRHYLGGLVNWSPDNDRTNLTVNALLNLQDPSGAFTPVFTYDFGQSTRVSLGGMITLGDDPAFAPTPRLQSEYGTYGDLLFTRMSVYF